MNIPMVDLKAEYALLKDEIEPAIAEALAAAQYIGGPNVRAFEKEVAAYCGVKHAIACASGTDALLLALRACGVGPGDEVITTPFTFVATASTVAMCAAKPVFVDIDPETFNMDISKIEAAITPRTRALIPVHIFGQPVDLKPVAELCKQRKLRLIEDSAQSFGAEYGGKKSGAYGDMGCFSFYPSKNLAAFGDGGMVITDNDELADAARVCANHGSRVRYHHHVLGYNSRLDELQAVVLRAKLKRIDTFNKMRRHVADAYTAHFEGSDVAPPLQDGKGLHVFHQYTLLSDRRDDIQAALNDAGIASAIYYPVPLHRQELFADTCKGVNLPVTDEVARRCLSLPISPLLSEENIEKVADVVIRAATA